jgi:hypothetical protein
MEEPPVADAGAARAEAGCPIDGPEAVDVTPARDAPQFEQ